MITQQTEPVVKWTEEYVQAALANYGAAHLVSAHDRAIASLQECVEHWENFSLKSLARIAELEAHVATVGDR